MMKNRRSKKMKARMKKLNQNLSIAKSMMSLKNSPYRLQKIYCMNMKKLKVTKSPNLVTNLIHSKTKKILHINKDNKNKTKSINLSMKSLKLILLNTKGILEVVDHMENIKYHKIKGKPKRTSTSTRDRHLVNVLQRSIASTFLQTRRKSYSMMRTKGATSIISHPV